MSTIGQRMSRADRKEMDRQVAEASYKGGDLYAAIEFKAEQEEDDFFAPVKFRGFGNTGHPDLGRDVVLPEAFTDSTIKEYLTHGRQLMFSHGFREQVGEITGASVVKTGSRSIVGNRMGGLKVEGFVDSPFDKNGMIPDHPLAHIIHFARMQVQKNRLKALSIGWMPVKTEIKRIKNPRTGVMENFRFIKSLLLREISLVTFAMNPQSTIELQKAMTCAYGEEITKALLCDDPAGCSMIPEKVDGLNENRVREMVVSATARAALIGRKTIEDDQEPDEGAASQLKLIHLEDRNRRPIKLVTLK